MKQKKTKNKLNQGIVVMQTNKEKDSLNHYLIFNQDYISHNNLIY